MFAGNQCRACEAALLSKRGAKAGSTLKSGCRSSPRNSAPSESRLLEPTSTPSQHSVHHERRQGRADNCVKAQGRRAGPAAGLQRGDRGRAHCVQEGGDGRLQALQRRAEKQRAVCREGSGGRRQAAAAVVLDQDVQVPAHAPCAAGAASQVPRHGIAGALLP